MTVRNLSIYTDEKIAIFIDGSNLYAAARTLGFDIDYKRLLEFFRTRAILVRAFYYTALIEDQDYSPIRPLVDWLGLQRLHHGHQTDQGVHGFPRAGARSRATWTSSSPST